MKIVLRTPLSQMSGYGKDGIGLARALLDRGHDVRVSPTFVGVPLPRDIAGLLTYSLEPPFDLAIHHLEPEHVRLDPSDAAASRVSVFWSMWEFESLDEMPWAPTFADRIRLFDHVVAYDSGTAQAFSPHVADGRLHTVQGGFEAEDWTPLTNYPITGPFTFGMNGRLTSRKGVYTAYQAFLSLQEWMDDFDADLVLRSTQPIFPENFPLPERVHARVGEWLPETLQTFYRSLDCLLCPSWGEGKNLPALEALACGTPVILSDIPAHRQWATSAEVTWVEGTRKALAPGLVGTFVSPQDLAAAMLKVYRNRHEERVKAVSASRTVRTGMDWTRCVERLSLACGLRL